MNGRLKRNGNGKNLSGNRGQTRFYSSNESRASIVRTLTFRCPRAFESVPRIASAPLEDRTGESHVAEAGVPVEMMKIESDPISKIGSSKGTGSARSCRRRPVSVDPFNCRFPRRVPL